MDSTSTASGILRWLPTLLPLPFFFHSNSFLCLRHGSLSNEGTQTKHEHNHALTTTYCFLAFSFSSFLFLISLFFRSKWRIFSTSKRKNINDTRWTLTALLFFPFLTLPR